MTTTLNASTAGAGGFIATSDNSGVLALQTAGTTAVTIDTSQNVGIGVTPSAWATLLPVQVKNGYVAGYLNRMYVGANNYYDGSNSRYIASDYATRYYQNAGYHAWEYAASGTAGNVITFTEAARIDSSGNLLVGQTTLSNTTVGGAITSGGIVYSSVAGSNNCYTLYSTAASAFRFYVTTGGQINATSTSISGISDASLKENIRDLETGLTTVMALKPRRFDWKEETKIDQKNVAGFIAQELEQVLPELVYEYQYNATETKKSIKMGDILPTLVKAIQEQQALITAQAETINALTARIVALESK